MYIKISGSGVRSIVYNKISPRATTSDRRAGDAHSRTVHRITGAFRQPLRDWCVTCAGRVRCRPAIENHARRRTVRTHDPPHTHRETARTVAQASSATHRSHLPAGSYGRRRQSVTPPHPPPESLECGVPVLTTAACASTDPSRSPLGATTPARALTLDPALSSTDTSAARPDPSVQSLAARTAP